MKRTLLALGIALAAMSATAADEGVTILDRAWTQAMLAGDVAAIGALYAPNAVMYPPDKVEVKGREAIQKDYAEMLNGQKVLEAKVKSAGVETLGDTSVGWGTFMIKMAPKAGGEPVVMEGRYTGVAKKINGKWLYVSDHASVSPPAPTPPK